MSREFDMNRRKFMQLAGMGTVGMGMFDFAGIVEEFMEGVSRDPRIYSGASGVPVDLSGLRNSALELTGPPTDTIHLIGATSSGIHPVMSSGHLRRSAQVFYSQPDENGRRYLIA